MSSSLCSWNTGSIERDILWAQWLFEVFYRHHHQQLPSMAPLPTLNWVRVNPNPNPVLPLVWLGHVESSCRASKAGMKAWGWWQWERWSEQAKHMLSNEKKTSAVYKLNDLHRCEWTFENTGHKTCAWCLHYMYHMFTRIVTVWDVLGLLVGE